MRGYSTRPEFLNCLLMVFITRWCGVVVIFFSKTKPIAVWVFVPPANDRHGI